MARDVEKLRKDERAVLGWPAIVNEIPQMLLDLSVGGAQVRFLHPDDAPRLPFEVRFSLFPQMPALVLQAQLVWKRGRRVGFRWVGLSKRNHKTLAALIRFHRA